MRNGVSETVPFRSPQSTSVLQAPQHIRPSSNIPKTKWLWGAGWPLASQLGFYTLRVPSGLPWECLTTSDSRTPFSLQEQSNSVSMAVMLTAHRASNARSKLALQGLFLILSPCSLVSHAWKHTVSVACLATYLPLDRT